MKQNNDVIEQTMGAITLKPLVPDIEPADTISETVEWRVKGVVQEVIVHKDGVVVLGIPEDCPESIEKGPMAEYDEWQIKHGHDCDLMGCGQCHVLWRHSVRLTAEPDPDVVERAKAFALKRHKLFFDREENLTVGSNFIDSMARFAASESAAVVARLGEYEAMLTHFDTCGIQVWSYHPACPDQPITIEHSDRTGKWRVFDENDGMVKGLPEFDTLVEAFNEIKKYSKAALKQEKVGG